MENEINKMSCLLAPNKSPEIDTGFYTDKYPLLASAKLDGFRALVTPDGIFSRNWKPFNEAVHNYFADVIETAKDLQTVVDGEIYSRQFRFDELASNLRSGSIDSSIRFYAFDSLSVNEWMSDSSEPFLNRYQTTVTTYRKLDTVAPLVQYQINNDDDLARLFAQAIEQGFEGLILRKPDSVYKHGRATMKQGIIFKLKQWVTVDSKIIGFKQRLKGGKRTGKIGSYLLKSSDGIEFAAKPGAGVVVPESWRFRNDLLGKFVECRFMKHGVKLKPRFAHITRLRPDLTNSDSIESLSSVLGS
jgi:DNA ligase-1